MTLLISCIDTSFIVMTADSAVTTYFSSGRTEYDRRSKSFIFPEVGCVTTWGEQIHNKIGRFLADQNITAQGYSVVDLAEITYHYLTQDYQPKEHDLDEVGYHIGGFDQEGKPRLFHVFWGFDRPRPPEQQYPDYKFYDHSDLKFLYNGRNDLAYLVVDKLILQLSTNADISHDISTSEGAIKFCDFVAQFAARVTPEVGPPFVSYLISPNNSIATIKNETFSPVDLNAYFGETSAVEPIVLFSDPSAVESQVFALPTGVHLDSLYYKHETSEFIVICSSCGRHYINHDSMLGNATLCPECQPRNANT